MAYIWTQPGSAKYTTTSSTFLPKPAGYPRNIFAKNPDSKYLCIDCDLVLREPIQTYCGHRYCRLCFDEQLGSDNGPVPCKGCEKEEIMDSYLNRKEMHPDRAISRDLSRFAVQCINDSCDWKGIFKDYQQHSGTCEHERIICIHRDGCGAIVKRKNLSQHLEKNCPMRMTKCSFCKNELPFKELRKHQDNCDEFVEDCRFCRQVRLPRIQLKHHQDPEKGDCSNRPVACPYHSVGCTVLMKQEGRDIHCEESVVDHQNLLCNCIMDIKSVIGQAESDRGNIEKLCEQTKSYDIQLTNLQETLKSLQERTQKMQADTVECRTQPKNVGQLESMLKSLSGKVDETKKLCSVLDTKVSTYEGIVAVLNSQIERDGQSVQILERKRQQDRESIEALERKIKAQDRIIALKDVALAEQDLRIQSLELASYDGVMIWKISDFNRRIQEARSGKTTSIYSPCFYTSRHGYKMCSRIYLNGDGMGKGNHVSLFFVIMRSHNDALLRWPFRQKVTFMWLDQNNREHVIDAFRPDPTSSSFQRPKHDMNIASGCPLFMPISQLDSSRHAYVKDDAAFIKIIVDTSDLG
ncbi:TNF receptor-associated factor 2-like isoform X1 [Glandiceps talaboti]